MNGEVHGGLTAKSIFYSAIAGVCAALLAGAVGFSSVVAIGFAAWSSDARIGWSSTSGILPALAASAIVVTASAITLLFAARQFANWLHSPVWTSVAFAGLVAVAGIHWLLWWLTVVNACGFQVEFPYWSIDSSAWEGSCDLRW